MGIKQKLKLFGVDLSIMKNSIKGIKKYISEYSLLKKQKGSDNEFPFGTDFPILADRYLSSGTMSGHYFHQDLLVAQKILKNNPLKLKLLISDLR